jgi:SAM-dependent methyltransferase
MISRLSNLISKFKKHGIRGSFKILKNKFKNNRISEFGPIKSHFRNNTGIEIGGPSWAFGNNGYMPIYDLMKSLDGVNYSSSTVWTGEIEESKGFIVNGKSVGEIFIADATDLSIVSNDAYEFVLSSNNIEHIANPMKALEQWILKLKPNGVVVIVAPRKEANFDHRRKHVEFSHLLEDYYNNTNEHDLTHLEEILELHDLSLDPQAGTFEQFKQRSLKNFEHRCLHHHVFNLEILEQMCLFFNLTPILMKETKSDHVIVGRK